MGNPFSIGPDWRQPCKDDWLHFRVIKYAAGRHVERSQDGRSKGRCQRGWHYGPGLGNVGHEFRYYRSARWTVERKSRRAQRATVGLVTVVAGRELTIDAATEIQRRGLARCLVRRSCGVVRHRHRRQAQQCYQQEPLTKFHWNQVQVLYLPDRAINADSSRQPERFPLRG